MHCCLIKNIFYSRISYSFYFYSLFVNNFLLAKNYKTSGLTFDILKIFSISYLQNMILSFPLSFRSFLQYCRETRANTNIVSGHVHTLYCKEITSECRCQITINCIQDVVNCHRISNHRSATGNRFLYA